MRQAKPKQESKNLHALRVGAGIDAAMFGRFVSGDRDARVDAAVHVAHAFSVHEQASEPDYFTAVDDLQAEEQGSGAGHLNTADLTSGLYYGYVVVDVPLLVSNLEACERKNWQAADRTLAAKTVEHLLHLVAKVTPGAKKGSTAPYDWASLVLVEAGDEQPRTLANAFQNPVRHPPYEGNAAQALSAHVEAIDGMYGAAARRWLATRIEGAVIPAAEAATLPALASAVATAIREEAEMQVLILRLEGPLMSFGDVAIDEIRPTRRLPARSMLTGLLANALGWAHRDVAALDRLQERLRFAARLDREGQGLVDFQTAELAKDDPLWTTRGVPAERAGGAASYSGPALRYRHYRADAAVTVALTLVPAEEAPDLAALEAALRQPERPLFIGRKGCPPGRPILDRLVAAESLVAALDQVAPAPPRRAAADLLVIETEDQPGEPEAQRLIAVADRRDWRLGLHAGQSRRRELRRPLPAGAP